MGLLDIFKRSSTPKPPTGSPPGSPVGSPPQPPFLATIASFEPGDGLGTLVVDGQSPVKFGRSACRGFEPAVGVTVEVCGTAAHPLGGWKATEVKLKSDAASYDALLSKRDAALGIEPKPLDPVEKAAATSQVLGWVIVLLDDSPPKGPAAFAEWAQRLGLQAAGIRVGTEGTFHLGIGKHDAMAYVGEGPFPRQRLTDLGAPDSFEPGRGFIGLSLGIPGQVPHFRVAGGTFDPWAADGQMRDVSRIAFELSKHGPAVILPQAGTLVSSEAFRARLGSLDDPRIRPFGAWIGLSVNHELGLYSSYGMVLQAQPNVVVGVDVKNNWELDRAREAILVACSTMVHSNQALKTGDRLVVPVGQPVGAGPIAATEGDVETYLVQMPQVDDVAVMNAQFKTGLSLSGDSILLRRADAAGVRSRWAITPPGRQPRVAFNTYQELLRHSLATFLDARQFTGLSPEIQGDYPVFEIDVWEARSGGGFFMTSNGIGRLPQIFGQQSDRTDHVELVAAMQDHHPVVANALAAVAAHVHLQKSQSDIFKPGDTVGIALPEIGSAGFVLADAGSVTIAEGPMIHLLELIPATLAEYALVRERGSASLLERVGKMSPAARAGRWKLKLT